MALSKELEDIEPEFHHFESTQLPKWKDKGAVFTLVAGKGCGKESPVPVHSKLFMIDIKTKGSYTFTTNGKLKGEIGICIVKGSISACDKIILKGNMLVSKTADVCNIQIHPNSHILLFGGEPFLEERYIFWNFVSHSSKKIEKAKMSWKNRDWPKVKNDKTYI